MKFEIVPVGEDNVIVKLGEIRIGEIFSGSLNGGIKYTYLRTQTGILNLNTMHHLDLGAPFVERIVGYRQEGNLVEVDE